MSMARRRHGFLVGAGLAAALVLSACGREIGDDCATNVDCGTDRICDLSQPGGYCTLSPCRPDTCPGEAVCVVFSVDDSYCMRTCETSDECREGYVCVTDYEEVPGFCNAARWSSVVLPVARF